MLEKITLQNFQKHQDLTVELDRFITVFSGKSDSGKTSIIRALRWVCFNRPSGEEFIKWGEEFAKVKLYVDDHIISRKRGKGTNSYQLDKQKYAAFGSSVPTEIEEILNLGEVNLQRQMESPFWFMLSGGEIAHQLNSILNLSLIDSTLSNIATKLKQTRMKVTVSEERIESYTKRKQELDWVKQADKEHKKIETIQKNIIEKHTKIDVLLRLVSQYHELDQSIKSASALGVDARNMLSLAHSVIKQKEQIVSLKNLVESINKEQENLCQYQQNLNIQNQLLRKVKVCPICQNPIKS